MAKSTAFRISILAILGMFYSASSQWVAWNLGCFGDSGNKLLRRNTSFESQNLVTTDCISYCFGYGYHLAGLKNGTQCFCGNDWTCMRNTSTDDGFCNVPCGGNNRTICGGNQTMTIYNVRDGKYWPYAYEKINKTVENPYDYAYHLMTHSPCPLLECAWFCNLDYRCYIFVHNEYNGACRLYGANTVLVPRSNHTPTTEIVHAEIVVRPDV